MRILSGKEPAAEIKKICRQTVRNMGFQPCLAVVVVGDNPASAVYVRNKQKDAEECGIKCIVYRYPADILESKLIMQIQEIAATSAIHGIIVQLPLPKGFDERKIIDTIPPHKDVDGLTTTSQGRLYTGQDGWKPCTPEGVIRLLDYYEVPIEGKTAVVVGRSSLVGAPLARMLQDRNATVCTYHTKTPEIMRSTDMPYYDILCFACGQPKKYNKYDLDCFDTGHQYTVVDIGINRDEEGTLCGDFDPNHIWDVELIDYTPVPGGIGLMTRAVLMDHVVSAACQQDAWRRGWFEKLKHQY